MNKAEKYIAGQRGEAQTNTRYTRLKQVGGVITRSAGVKFEGKIDFANPGGVQFAPVQCDLAT